MPFQPFVLADRVVGRIQDVEQSQRLGLTIAFEVSLGYRVALGSVKVRNALAGAVFFKRLGEMRDRSHEDQRCVGCTA